jgi:hypothetical protein
MRYLLPSNLLVSPLTSQSLDPGTNLRHPLSVLFFFFFFFFFLKTHTLLVGL